MAEDGGDGETLPASPFSRLMHTPKFNLSIIAIMGFNATVDVPFVKLLAAQSLLKHPRFRSILVFEDEKRYRMSWRPKKVNIDEHVFAPDINQELDTDHGNKFVNDFISTIARLPMDLSKPLWELHVLNVKTTNSTATAVFKFHHSVGDGVSLMSLVLACGRQVSDPEALPVLPTSFQRRAGRQERITSKGLFKAMLAVIWTAILIVYFTVIDVVEFVATVFFYKDSHNPIKAGKGIEDSPKRYVHRVLNMDDVKLIKNSLESTVNDVFLGITEAALTRYLQRRLEKNKEKEVSKTTTTKHLRKFRIRAAVPFNLRPSPTIQDTYEVMEKGKKMSELKMWAVMNRKKLSYLALIEYYIVRLIIKVFGIKVTAKLLNMFISHITFGISSVIGPRDEINFFGHPLIYLAPTVTGLPVSMVVHFQSYAGKLILFLAIDDALVPDADQLCDDFQHSLQLIKDAVVKKIPAESESNRN